MPKFCTASRTCITNLSFGINLLGGGLTFFYLTNIGVLSPSSFLDFQLVNQLFFIGVVILAIAGEVGHGIVLGQVYKSYYQIIEKKEKDISLSLQFRAINLPAIISFSSWVLWLFAALIFGGILWWFAPAEHGLYIFAQVFLSVGIISGITTSILIYFTIERYWQPFIPAYFPHGDMEKVLSLSPSIFQRLFVLFFLGMMPLFVMAGLTYDRVSQTSAEISQVLGELREIYIFVIGASFFVALFLAFTVGKSLTNFSRDLQNVMRKVLEGNLEASLPVTTSDDMGKLARGFNDMLVGLRQEELVRGLFERYVGTEVAHHLMDEGKSFDAELVDATILFIDIRQFTNLSEKLPPEILLKLLNRFLGEMSKAIAENGGLVHKFIGDSIMAIYGTPLNPTRDNPALGAVNTAQSMLTRLKVINQIHQRENLPPLKIGVGIASGKIVAGTLGEGERVEYTFIGDAVNLASRLEGMTKELPVPILFDAETAARLPAERYFEVGEMPVRGKEKPIVLFAPNLTEAREKFILSDYFKPPKNSQVTFSVPVEESFLTRIQKKSKKIFNREK